MNIKLITASFLISALPLSAQADPATERALQLSEPLSTKTQATQVSSPLADVLSDIVAEGSSAAMAKARLKLSAQQQEATDIAISENARQLTLNSTK